MLSVPATIVVIIVCETYYEKFGLYIPNVIFPTGGYVEGNVLHVYYGACDTAIARASVNVDELLTFME